jgi:Retroviral aspartyl protease
MVSNHEIRGYYWRNSYFYLDRQCGSIHSFISPVIVQKISLKTHGTTPLSFTTASNATLTFYSICRNITFYLQGHEYEGDLRVLKVNGHDVILGMD